LRRLIVLGLVAVLVIVMSAPAALFATGGGNNDNKGKKKVTICHKGKTIKVSKNAVKAHKKHGDKIGKPCGKDNGKFHKCDTDKNGIVTPSEKVYCKKDDDNGGKDDDNGDNHHHGDDREDRG
jgi:hypothetical protein